MAEVVGVVASAISIGGLVLQIFDAVQKIRTFCTAVRDAPKEIKDTLDELEIFAQILLELQADSKSEKKEELVSLSVQRCVRSCQKAAEDLADVAVSLAEGLSGSKSRRQWASIKKVLRNETIKENYSRLERAKSALNLTVSLLIYRQVGSMGASKNEPGFSTKSEDVELGTDTPIQYPLAKFPPRGLTSARQLSARSWWLGLGWYSYQSVAIQIFKPHHNQKRTFQDKVTIDQRFIPRFRLFANGLWIQSTRIHGNWQYTFRPIQIIPHSAPIFEACRNGDLERVIQLFDEGTASIYDNTHDGWTLVHESAKYARPIVCRWLIAQGAQSCATDMKHHRTPLHVVVKDAFPYQICKDTMSPEKTLMQGNICSGDEMYETIRLLVEEGQCDPMMNDSQNLSVLHCYRGPVEPFQYLIHLQQHFLIDLAQRSDNNLTVTQYHAAHRKSSPKIVRTLMGLGPIPCGIAVARNASGSTWLISTVIRLVKSFSEEQSLDQNLDLIADLIDAGADLNACNDQGATSLDRILAFQLEAEDKRPLIHQWLKLLLLKNVDLHQYALQEEKLHDKGRVNDVWAYRRGIERYFTIYYGKEINDITINVKDRRVQYSDATRIPGAWDAEAEYAQSLGRELIEGEELSAEWSISSLDIQTEASTK